MIVTGNLSPAPLFLEFHPQDRTKVIVFLRENIEIIQIEFEEGTVEMFQYDEYQILAKYYDGIQADIERDIDNWIATGRTLAGKEKI